ncbi:MAG: formylglycine-generating enzyme family protein [Thermodesulfobacteriota bacterium]|nr:formylglycine-generating enzyme family protein [Thermodesulfobacteriota bacterium]
MPFKGIEGEQEGPLIFKQENGGKEEPISVTTAKEEDALDIILNNVKQKEEEFQTLQDLERRKKEEKQKEREEKERLARDQVDKKLKRLYEDTSKYQRIVLSRFGKDKKISAWESLTSKYPEESKFVVIGDVEGLRRRVAEKSTNSVGMKFMYIPPGTFLMGSPPDELGRHSDEIQHQVTLTKGFYMQTTEVTQAQWKAVMENNPSYFKGDDLPVERISWNEAQEFIQKLNEIEATGRYRLPTEAEWEYACRSGNMSAYYFGNSGEELERYAWYGGGYLDKTSSVGKKKPNAWGLYDMHGNVWEWCQDWFGKYPSASVVDPKGPPLGQNIVYRGGSWFDAGKYCRSAFRYRSAPGFEYHHLGFRVVR